MVIFMKKIIKIIIIFMIFGIIIFFAKKYILKKSNELVIAVSDGEKDFYKALSKEYLNDTDKSIRIVDISKANSSDLIAVPENEDNGFIEGLNLMDLSNLKEGLLDEDFSDKHMITIAGNAPVCIYNSDFFEKYIKEVPKSIYKLVNFEGEDEFMKPVFIRKDGSLDIENIYEAVATLEDEKEESYLIDDYINPYFQDESRYLTAKSYDELIATLNNGEAAMAFIDSDGLLELKDSIYRFSISLFFGDTISFRIPYKRIYALSVRDDTDKKEEAVDFLKYCLLKETQKRISKDYYVIPNVPGLDIENELAKVYIPIQDKEIIVKPSCKYSERSCDL